MERRFTWQIKKAERNLRVHGITFEAAQGIFDDPNIVVMDNYYIADEQRLQAIGFTKNLLLLLVVFIERQASGGEIVHLISARKAVKYEENIYRDGYC